VARGGFWLARQRDDRDEPPPPLHWPAVAAVVPARDEADVIARSIGSLLVQDYPGAFRVVLVDDGSSDGTVKAARAVAESLGAAERLTVLQGAALPAGWTGKVWAQHQGIARAAQEAPEYLLLTDADIHHSSGNLRALVGRAEQGRHALVSLMALLCCTNLGGAVPHPRLRVLFPDALPLPLGGAAGAAHLGSGGRLHAGARGPRWSRRAASPPSVARSSMIARSPGG
jgi:glycosyltransferase involved in cell wall biosynthesis